MNLIIITINLLVRNVIILGHSDSLEKVKSNNKASKFSVGDRVRIKYENMRIFLAKIILKLVKRNVCCWFYIKS